MRTIVLLICDHLIVAKLKSFVVWTCVIAMPVCIPFLGQTIHGEIDSSVACSGSAVRISQTGWGPEIKETTPSESTRLLVQKAIADGHQEIPVVIASEPGGIDETAALVRGSGGRVLSCISNIGYMHAVVPTAVLSDLIQSPFVTDVAVSGSTMFSGDVREVQPQRFIPSAPTIAAEEAERYRDTRASAAYSSKLPFLTAGVLRKHPEMDPNHYMQVGRWRKEHPLANGRGITVAIFDGVGDLGHPALRWALNSAGERIPKIAGIIDPVDHRNPNPAGYFDQSDDDGQVHFSAFAKSFCPKPSSDDQLLGTWTLHWYADQKQLCVAWNKQRETMRVALPGDTAFHSSQSITEFNHHASYLRFSVKRIFPADESSRSVTLFCIQDVAIGQVFIHLGQDAHSTMVATAAAGTSIMGTGLTGVAPAARVLYIEPGDYRISQMVEGMWSAAVRSDVDVLSITTGIDSYPDDPQPIIPLFLDRISVASSKPVFVAAGNEGGALEQNARGGRVINTVGAYDPGQMMREFGYQDHADVDRMADYSAAGPNANGSWSTTILAPALGIAGWECGDTRPHPASARVVGNNYRVPSCWATGEGTSVTAPRAAGLAALILSAAKLQHISVSPAQMRQALIDSASPLPDSPSSWQGAGRIQVESAWDSLTEQRVRGEFLVRSRSPDVLPLYQQFWRGEKTGATVYLTSGIHSNAVSTASLEFSSDRSLTGCSASLEHPSSGFTVQTTHRGNFGKVLDLLIAIHPPNNGVLSQTIEVHCAGYSYPIERVPITVLAAQSKN